VKAWQVILGGIGAAGAIFGAWSYLKPKQTANGSSWFIPEDGGGNGDNGAGSSVIPSVSVEDALDAAANGSSSSPVTPSTSFTPMQTPTTTPSGSSTPGTSLILAPTEPTSGGKGSSYVPKAPTLVPSKSSSPPDGASSYFVPGLAINAPTNTSTSTPSKPSMPYRPTYTKPVFTAPTVVPKLPFIRA